MSLMLKLLMGQNFGSQRWQQFLVYIGFTLGAFVINAFLNSVLPLIYRGACMCVLLPHFSKKMLKIKSFGRLVGLLSFPSPSLPVLHQTTIRRSE